MPDMTLTQRIEPFIAFLMGAPVKSRSGKVYHWHRTPQKLHILVSSLFGFDFSKWQGIIDFLKVFAYGARFIILRASYGITGDQKFLENMPKCLEYFPAHTSVYHYYDPQYSPQSQYNRLIAMIAPYKASIKRVWIDLEFSWTGSYSASSYWKQFAELLLSGGYKIGFYTRKTWWDSRVGSFSSWFGQYPLWAAQYNTSLTLIPLGWSKADLWQSGTPAIGAAVGTESLEVDYDISDDEFFYSEYGEIITPPTGEPTVTTYNLTATASPTKQFSDAAATNDVGPNIAYGTKLVSTARNGITYRNDATGKYVKYTQVRLDSTVEVPPPPVEPPPATVTVTDVIIDAGPGTVVTIKKSDGSQVVIP